MSRRRWFVAATVLVVAGIVAAYWYDSRQQPSRRLSVLRREHEALQARLERALGSQALLEEAEDIPGDVVVGLRGRYANDVIRAAARAYLDRVTLNLQPNIKVYETGKMEPKTFLGKIDAGRWFLKVTVSHLRGVLRAGTPEIVAAAADRVTVKLPVTMESGRGSGTLEFEWDARSLAGVVCRDFAVRENLEALGVPLTVTLKGAFVIAARPEGLSARPDFGEQPFHLSLDLTPDSWSKVEAALAAQDTFLRCGIVLDPQTVLPKLRDLVQKGFDVKLPRSLFRAVELPGRVQSKVVVQGVPVTVEAASSGLRLTEETWWFGSTFSAQMMMKAEPTAAGTP